MSRPITIFQGSAGLNIVDDPVRAGRQQGAVDLQAAVNVSIDRSGRVRSRRGVTQLQSGSYHSLFCDGGDCFVVQGDTLYQVAMDGTTMAVKTGLTAPAGTRMSYAQTGERTYYANGFDLGVVYHGVNEEWTVGTYVGPDTHRQFTGPVPGNHLAVFYGRMMISKDNVLMWSEPYNFGLYDMARAFIQLNTKIRMIKPVDAGMFLSTEQRTYFFTGTNPFEWTSRQVAGYPAVEWTDPIEYVDSADIGGAGGRCAVWAGTEGAVMGMPDGSIRNLNKRKVIYPEAARTGFGGMLGYNFIHGVE